LALPSRLVSAGITANKTAEQRLCSERQALENSSARERDTVRKRRRCGCGVRANNVSAATRRTFGWLHVYGAAHRWRRACCGSGEAGQPSGTPDASAANVLSVYFRHRACVKNRGATWDACRRVDATGRVCILTRLVSAKRMAPWTPRLPSCISSFFLSIQAFVCAQYGTAFSYLGAWILILWLA